MATNFSKELVATPGKKVKLADWDPEETLGWEKGDKMRSSLGKSIERIDKLQYLLYALLTWTLTPPVPLPAELSSSATAETMNR